MPSKKESRTDALRRSSEVAKDRGWSADEQNQTNRKRLIELIRIMMREKQKQIDKDRERENG
jgi:hypothetical protein